MKKTSFTWKKNIIYILGLTALAICVTLIQKSNLGMAAWDALNRNFYEGIPLEYKYLTPAVALVLITVAYLLEKKQFDLWMLFPLAISFFIGFMIDLLLLVIPDVSQQGVVMNLLYLSLAILVCAVGLNLIVFCRYPLPALDQLCLAISHRLRVSFGRGKLIGEGIALVLTVLIGLFFSHEEYWFYIGPTTIIFAFFIGFVVDWVNKPLFAFLDGFSDKSDGASKNDM